MQTTKQYVHLAGVVFRDDADALGRQSARGTRNGYQHAGNGFDKRF